MTLLEWKQALKSTDHMNLYNIEAAWMSHLPITVPCFSYSIWTTMIVEWMTGCCWNSGGKFDTVQLPNTWRSSISLVQQFLCYSNTCYGGNENGSCSTCCSKFCHHPISRPCPPSMGLPMTDQSQYCTKHVTIDQMCPTSTVIVKWQFINESP